MNHHTLGIEIINYWDL